MYTNNLCDVSNRLPDITIEEIPTTSYSKLGVLKLGYARTPKNVGSSQRGAINSLMMREFIEEFKANQYTDRSFSSKAMWYQ